MSWKQLECRISILTARPLHQGRMPANVPSPLPLGLLTQHRDGAVGCGLLSLNPDIPNHNSFVSEPWGQLSSLSM